MEKEGRSQEREERKEKESTKPTKSPYLLIESAALDVGKRPGGLAVEIVSWLRRPVT